MHCPVVRIKPTHPSQGEFVEINASDYDADKHELHVSAPPPAPVPVIPPPPAPVDPLDTLPKDWRTAMEPAALLALASAVSGGRTPENSEQAVAMIDAALLARVPN